MRSIISIWLFIISASGLQAAAVVIHGEAITYAGKRIAALTSEDEFSGKRILLNYAEVADNGAFTLTFELSEIRRIFLNINRVEAVMYAEPGHSYDIIFPADGTASIKRFDKTEVELEFKSLPADDLNQLIRDFNADFSDFLGNHYYDFAVGEFVHADAWLKSRGDSKTKVDLYKPAVIADTSSSKEQPGFNNYVANFRKEVNDKYQQPRLPFFEDYVNYSLAEIDLLAGMKRVLFYKNYFMSRELPLKNPAFVRSFSLFYHGFLTKNSTEKQNSIVKSTNVNKNPREIIDLFENDSTCVSYDVRTLALVNGMKQLYHDKTFTRRSIEKTLQNVVSDNLEIQLIAKNILASLQKRREDYPVENFTCLNGQMDKWELNDHTGHALYFLFFATWSPTSIKELQVMQKWHEKYGKHIEFIAVSMDDDYDQYKDFMANNRDLKFEILFGSADPLLTEKAMLYAIPEAMMLNNEGRTVYAHTKKPSEGIQIDFDKIMLQMQQGGAGPKTWKN